MSTIEHSTPKFNTCEQARPAFVTAGGQIYRSASQGGIRRCTALDLALMSTAAATFWRIETQRQED